MEIPNNILALLVLVSVGLSIAALIIRGPKGIPGSPGKSIQGGQGLTGPPGPAGPQGPAGTMIVQCSPTSSGSNNCKGMIPGSLEVNGLLTSDTITTSGDLTVGTNTWSSSGNIKTSGNLTVGTNTWSPSGNINTSGNIKTTSGNIVIESDTAYLGIGAPTKPAREDAPPHLFYWSTSTLQNGKPWQGGGGAGPNYGNFWSSNGDLTANGIIEAGYSIMVGSPSNTWGSDGIIKSQKGLSVGGGLATITPTGLNATEVRGTVVIGTIVENTSGEALT